MQRERHFGGGGGCGRGLMVGDVVFFWVFLETNKKASAGRVCVRKKNVKYIVGRVLRTSGRYVLYL